jgi:hypothetical protein
VASQLNVVFVSRAVRDESELLRETNCQTG